MEHKKYKGIIYLRRNGFDFYSQEKAMIFKFDFTVDTVCDLEVINKEELNKQLKSFIEGNKIAPANLSIIVAEDLLLKKDIGKPMLNQEAVEVQKYLDIVPFSDITVKILHLGNISQVLVVNKNFYQAISESFENAGFVIANIFFSAAILGKDAVSLSALDIESAKYILTKVGSLKSDNLLEGKMQKIQPFQNNNHSEYRKKPMLLLILAGVFIILLGILAFFLKKFLFTNTP